MKISLAVFVSGLIVLGALIGLSIAIFLLRSSLHELFSSEKREVAELFVYDAQKYFSNKVYNATQRVHKIAENNKFKLSIASNNQQSAVHMLLNLQPNSLANGSEHIYINRKEKIGWIDTKQIFSASQPSNIISILESTKDDSPIRLTVATIGGNKRLTFVYSTPITAPKSFENIATFRAIHDMGTNSTMLNEMREAMRAKCLILYGVGNLLNTIGPSDCVEMLVRNLKKTWIKESTINSSYLFKDNLLMASAQLSDAYQLDSLRILAVQDSNILKAQTRQLWISIQYISSALMLASFLTTALAAKIIRNSMGKLLASLGSNSSSKNIPAINTFIKEFQLISKTHHSIRAKLIHEANNRAAAENDVEYLNNKLRSAHTSKMESLGTLTAGVTHDFNNILAIIKGNLELLQIDSTKTNSSINRFNVVTEAVDRASALVDDLLLYVRKDDKLVQQNDLSIILQSIAKLLPSALGPQISINLEIEEGIDFFVNVDNGKCTAAIMNLSTNAKDAMPTGGMLTFSLRKINKDTDISRTIFSSEQYCILEVKDTGSGIDKEKLDRIFEPFFTTKNVGAGVGLGLSIVYNFIEQSNGYLEVQSKIGEGTTFQLFLPMAKKLEKQQNKTNKLVKLNSISGSKILVVDDEAGICQFMRVLLEKSGSIVTTTDGVEAAKTIITAGQDNHFDYLITDMNLPDGQGVDIIKHAIDVQPNIIIVVISGYLNQVHDDLRALKIENYSVLQKPFSSAQLFKVLCEASVETHNT